MFTGIIEAIGKIKHLDINQQGARLTIDTGTLDMSDVKLGDSIATNGICLTVTNVNVNSFTADVSRETLTRSAMAYYKHGQQVNLEKAMLPTTRFGGHIVSGHVDGLSEVKAMSHHGNSIDYWLSMDQAIAPYIAEKGSITIDGVSLTVNSLSKDSFRLTIVPHTSWQTIMTHYQVGTQVNIEVDVMARYIERLLLKKDNTNYTSPTGVTETLLKQSGFLKG
jgi:riboflavin synthase